ncbi:hypothetical protein Poly24_31930 [Rosistilla carotiformis]|uniref:Uncharacterized protein n=1 Tax=Rosistilla carotiformis TaxID=2528017 RepID=A0A518JVB9_9BACT|nr:hypothetical protein [Rosistilla carotiformis]QDV69477.1 hypothetical protein Poly24_31930 [Rosistilla carotiformis]
MIAPANNRFQNTADRPSRDQAWQIAYQSLAEEGLLEDSSPTIHQRASAAVGQYPLLSVTVAVALGLAVGCWAKRSG